MIAWLRKFAERRINSRLMDQRRNVAPHIVLELGRQGFFGMTIPMDLGGSELTVVDFLRVLEQTAAVDPTLALLVGIHDSLGCRPLVRYGSEALPQELLRDLAAGRQLAAFAITEPGAGSNPRAIRTEAIKTAGGWRVTGEKWWSGLAAWAGVISGVQGLQPDPSSGRDYCAGNTCGCGGATARAKQTRFLSSPAIQRVTGRSTFDLADLKPRRLTVYLILPPRHLDTYKRWLRLMVVSASLATVTTVPGMPAERILFMIDEFQNLDRMEPVLRDYALVRGYGATFWLVVQDIPKLKGVYPNEWETFFDNRSVLQAFGTSGPQTAEYLSKLLGETTILTESESRNQGYSSGKSSSTQRGTGETISEKGRRLLTPDEIINLPPDQQLLFVRGVRPILGRRLNYLEDPEFTGLAEDNPQHASA